MSVATTWRPSVSDTPERLYVVTGGRSRVPRSVLDLVTLVVSQCEPVKGMQSEHAQILRICRDPMSVAEIGAALRLPLSVVRILLADLLETGHVRAQDPSTVDKNGPESDLGVLQRVLAGLQKL